MSEASKTPETNRLLLDLYGTDRVKAEEIVNAHARSLELRLTEALDRAQRAEERVDRLKWERDFFEYNVRRLSQKYNIPEPTCGPAHDLPCWPTETGQSSKIAELEKDAARYRWLREQQTINDSEWCVISQTAPMCVPHDLDAAIDLASSGQGERS